MKDESDITKLQKDPISQNGDIWRLHYHAIACDDSCSEMALRRLMGRHHAAPSIAFATLGIAWVQHGPEYAGIQASAVILRGIDLPATASPSARSCCVRAPVPDSNTGLASGLADRRP